MGDFENLQYFAAWCDEAKLPAADLHVAVQNHEHAEACAVQEFDTGEIEDEFFNPAFDDFGDFGLDFAQAHAKRHATCEMKHGSRWIDALQFRFEDHVLWLLLWCLQAYQQGPEGFAREKISGG